MKYRFIFMLSTAVLLNTPMQAAEDHGHNDGHGHELSLDSPTARTEKNHDSLGGHQHDEGDEKDGHGDEHGHGEEKTEVELSSKQLKEAGIVVSILQPQSISQLIIAPGEVSFNAYQSKKITPRITAQIVKRHKRLGQFVKQGQVLVTLSSVEMAQAQGELIVADREWQRVKKLGKKVVSERRYVAAQIAHQQAYAKTLAFGMTKPQVDELLKNNDPTKAVGRFQLLATRDGTITNDAFIEGEIVEPGRVLFQITDESSMWVEARLTPNEMANIKQSAVANIIFGEKIFPGKIVQIHHRLDETTRTLAVRLEVNNPDDALHPGLFVQTQIQSQSLDNALSLPASAVLRTPDGDWAVLVETQPGHFKPQEITVVRTIGDQVVIDGITAGTRVVTQGAFFVQSEMAKGGFDPHNH